jgi:lambda family phage portal protein
VIFDKITHFFSLKSSRQATWTDIPKEFVTRELSRIMERYYPAAELGKQRQDWNPAILVDQNILRLEYKRIFARAKRAYDTDPYAKAVVRVLQDQIVGRGISARARPFDKNMEPIPELALQLNKFWPRFTEECFRPSGQHFYDIQYKFIANCNISGGMFLNFIPSSKGSMLPFAFQQIDQSYLEFSHDNYAIATMPLTCNGVKVDEFGEPQHYFFQDLVNWTFFDMPANNMIHCFEKLHFNQFIGIPWLAPVLTTLWDLAQLQEDKLIASRVQAAIAMWVEETSKWPDAGAKNLGGNIEWAPGKIIKSKIKPEILQAADSIRETFGALIELYLRQVASGMGISYSEMTTDISGATFSSARVIVNDRRRHYKKQQDFVTRVLCKPVYRKFVQWCFLSGLIPGKSIIDFRHNAWGYSNAVWVPDKWDWVDPLKDIDAVIAERNAGLSTDEEYCELRSKNREDLYDTLELEKKEREKRGIAVVSNPAGSEKIHETNKKDAEKEEADDANKKE